MAADFDPPTTEFLTRQRVARLATADADGRPTVVPICFAFDGSVFYSPIDAKPKSVSPRNLKRIRNIVANPHVSIVIDEYSDDWSKLVYVLVSGLAEVLEPSGKSSAEHGRAVELLRIKYPQYRDMAIDDRPLIKVVPVGVKRWTPR